VLPAACEGVLRYAGLDPKLHAFGTEVKGVGLTPLGGCRWDFDSEKNLTGLVRIPEKFELF